MYTYKYSYCGYTFKIDSLYEYFYLYSKEYVTTNKEDYSILVNKEDLEAYILEHHNKENLQYVEVLYIQSQVASILAKHNAFIMHGAAISFLNNDNGYLFTGPSGVGKSTHVNKLKDEYGDSVTIINDDKPFVSYENDAYYLYGSPWSGKSHISKNIKVRLKGIFVLYQSKDNKINRISESEAINYLAKQIHIPKGKIESNLGLEFLIKLIKDIPIYHLGVNLAKESVYTSSEVMKCI